MKSIFEGQNNSFNNSFNWGQRVPLSNPRGTCQVQRPCLQAWAESFLLRKQLTAVLRAVVFRVREWSSIPIGFWIRLWTWVTHFPPTGLCSYFVKAEGCPFHLLPWKKKWLKKKNLSEGVRSGLKQSLRSGGQVWHTHALDIRSLWRGCKH